MSAIHFEAKPFTIDSWTILELPREVSSKLPSRGMVMVKGTINDIPFQSPLEPDGKGSHWLNIDTKLQHSANIEAGDSVSMSIEPTTDWPEPVVPADLQAALVAKPEIQKLWADITPMARWDWLRWMGSTKQSETRKRRIDVAFSKLRNGERRPCCFNRTMCAEPAVSKNGVLLSPLKTAS